MSVGKACPPRYLRCQFACTSYFIQYTCCRGAEAAHRALLNEALYGVLRILGLINPAYLHKVWSIRGLGWGLGRARVGGYRVASRSPIFSQKKPGADPIVGFRAQHRLVDIGLGTTFSGSAGLRV